MIDVHHRNQNQDLEDNLHLEWSMSLTEKSTKSALKIMHDKILNITTM